jgi:radical SAM protein with 4Fe4S-binding SPASM domain
MSLSQCLNPLYSKRSIQKNFWNNEFSYVTLVLFNKCHLNCEFCFQDKTVPIDIEAIKNIPDKLIQRLSEKPINSPLRAVKFTIMGGELFSDDIPDSMFEVYEELCNNFINKLRSYIPELQFGFVWITSGVYIKLERIRRFFNRTSSPTVRSKMGLSYDAVGRFKNEYQRSLCINTFNYFKDNMDMLSITLTKDNINAYINGKDQFLIDYPENVASIDACYYIPNKDYKHSMPDDNDLYNFYKWVVDNNIWNIGRIQLMVDSLYYKMKQKDTYVMDCSYIESNYYINNEFRSDCTLDFCIKYLLNDEFNNVLNDEISSENKIILQNAINSYIEECSYCYYNNICTGRCWYNKLFNKGKNIECPIKRLYQYIENNNDIKNSYIKWSDEYGYDRTTFSDLRYGGNKKPGC